MKFTDFYYYLIKGIVWSNARICRNFAVMDFFLARLLNLIFFLFFSVITACQKLPRLQFFDLLLKNLMPRKENISWQWSQVWILLHLKAELLRKIQSYVLFHSFGNISLFLLTIAKKKFQENPYLIIILISNPIAVFNSAQWNQCLDH